MAVIACPDHLPNLQSKRSNGAPQSASETAMQIGTNSDWQSMSSSIEGYHHLLRKRDGTFWIMERDRAQNTTNLKPVAFPKSVIAYDAGGGAFAVLTRDGQVWTCGTVLGQQTPKDKIWDFLARQLYRIFGKKIPWRQPTTITRDDPWQLRNVEPTSEK